MKWFKTLNRRLHNCGWVMERRTGGTMAEILCKVKKDGRPGRIVDTMVLDYIPD